jgi:hypothetical protein
MWRWLAADPREVVDLAGARALAGGNSQADLGAELRRWRGIVARRRLVALVRRHGAVALALAALLEILAQLDAIPQWVVVAVPLALFVASVAFFFSRGPSPFGLARLLDDKLGLNDRLATALQIEARSGEEAPLERRTVADAATLLAAGREDWHASPARGGREWWAPLGALAAIAIVVAIGAATASDSTAGPRVALGPEGAGAGGNSPGSHKRAKAEKAHEKQLAPTGKLHKFKGKNVAPSEQQSTKAGGYRRIPQGYKSNGKEAQGANNAKAGKAGTGKAPTGKLHKNSGATNGEEKHGEEKTPPGTDGQSSPKTKPPKEKKEKIGFNIKGQKHGGQPRPGPSHVSGAGTQNKPSSGKGKAGGESGAQESAKGGKPSGAGKAGGEQGTAQKAQATPIKGTATQSVRIQPGYAPSRSKKGGAEKHKTGVSQGAGGKARTAQVTGATQVGDEFSYVPAAGGAVPGPSAGLQQNYLESLKWVEKLPW